MSIEIRELNDLELRPLEAHELDIVSGAQAPQVTATASGWKGIFWLDLKTVIWETQFRGPKHLAMPAGT
jgi:hypothetical protein